MVAFCTRGFVPQKQRKCGFSAIGMADGGYKAYQRIVKGKKTNGLAWFRLGMAHHNIGNYTEAVKPYQEALNL